MKIFSASQIRDWDKYTIAHEPISSIELMERAAKSCTAKITGLFPNHSFIILCGPGNNGGDGLAIARLLQNTGNTVLVYHPGDTDISVDNKTNLDRWSGPVAGFEAFNPTGTDTVVIDAIFGTGQNRPPQGMYKEVIEKVNNSRLPVVSVDIPSGMYADKTSAGNTIIHARYTLSFQCMKLAFLVPENGDNSGEVIVLDIGLSQQFYNETDCRYEMTGAEEIKSFIKPRDKFAHKGSFGTALLLAGKKGMMGAAILASKACLRTGVGKLVCRIPQGGLDIMQTVLPEAICDTDEDPECLVHLPSLENYNAIGIGPGIGRDSRTATLVKQIMEQSKQPLVMDADALNIIAEKELHYLFKEGMVITPHVGEFQRITGKDDDDFRKIQTCQQLSTDLGICVILKGHYSFLSTPRGKGYFNTTGNAGMAKAGSGDVLTGMVTALLAQGYSVDKACRLGMYVHGAAGDLARSEFGEASFIATDIINHIGRAVDRILL